jgi:hypothetical protein
LYEEVKGNMWPFVNLHRLATNSGINTQMVLNLLKIANNDPPIVESVIERRRAELNSLEFGKQIRESQIFDLHNTLLQYRKSCKEEIDRVGRLDQKRLELEQFVRQFENNNESYAKIKKTAKQEVECALAKSVLWKNCSTIYTTRERTTAYKIV